MGLLDFFKSLFGGTSGHNLSAQVQWLQLADAAYTKAFQTRNIRDMQDYFTRPCQVRIAERVRLGEKIYSGLSRYQNVTWVKKAETPERTVWIKNVTYDQINMSHGIVVPVGDNTSEEWIVILENGIKKVAEIRRVL